MCCDVVRSGLSDYRCYLRLDGSCTRRVCIFEAVRARAKGLRSAHYVIRLPADARLLRAGEEKRCGKVRSFAFGGDSLSFYGTSFVLYDDGRKPGARPAAAAEAVRDRRELAAVAFARRALTHRGRAHTQPWPPLALYTPCCSLSLSHL